MISSPWCISLGRGESRPTCQRAELEGDPRAAIARAIAEHAGPEAWWSMSLFRDDYRKGSSWESACAVAIDLDQAGHAMFPPEEAAKAIEALRDVGSLAHGTPHGLRVLLVLDEPATEKADYRRACRGAAALVTRTLAEAGVDGLTADRSVTADVTRFLWTPRATVACKREGHTCTAARTAEVQLLRRALWSIEDLGRHAPAPHVELPPAPRVHAISGATTPYGRAALDGEARRVADAPKGERHAALYKAAAALGELVAGGTVTRFEAEAVLLEAAASHGCGGAHVESTIRDGLDRGATQPRGAPERNGHHPGKAEPNRATPGTACHRPARQVDPPEPWEPYPLDALPRSLLRLASEGAESIGCDPAFVALAALVACAGAIGLARRARIKPGKRGWREPSILWAALVADSGAHKSPPFELAEEPLRELEAAARRRHERELAEWTRAAAAEKIAARTEKRPPEIPSRPTERRYCARDTTIQALSTVLDENPRGVPVLRDELRGWVESWARYADGATDAPQWLELYGGRGLRVDRADATRRAYVPYAGVSIAGTIQPGILRRVLTPEHLESGCGARILFAMPPRTRRRWRAATISDEAVDVYSLVVRALSMLPMETEEHPDGSTSLRPLDIPLSAGALDIFAAWVDELGAEAWGHDGPEAAAASKLEGVAARIALVIELAEAAEGTLAVQAIEAEDAALAAEAAARNAKFAPEEEEAADQGSDPDAEGEPDGMPWSNGPSPRAREADARRTASEAADLAAREARRAADRALAALCADVREVGEVAMERGIRIARWHWRETRRVLALLAPEEEAESPEGRDRRRLLEWLGKRGEEGATARETARGVRPHRTPAEAEAALAALVEDGVVERVTGPRTAVYRIARVHTTEGVHGVHVHASAGGEAAEPASVDVDGVDTPEAWTRATDKAQPRRRWGAAAEAAS